ncbi:MAG TPA: DUF2298 domain-containing protein [Pyrinomonadaceae bacterium]|nr:DUF2298 domain-containing protein [Pyrinomonadaceae bacterium]
MNIITFLSWLLLIWALGWLFLPLARRIWGRTALGDLPDAGLAAGRLVLLWGWTLVAFWLGNARVSTRLAAYLIYPLAGVCVYYAARDWANLRELVRERKRALLLSDGVFLGVFLLFFLLRGFWPDINNGEKPMDMILISSLANADYLPPPNPYAAGTRLSSYYYLGHLQTALLGNAVGVVPRWSYNLMSATLPALCYSTLAALAAGVTNRLRNGLVAALLILTAGTLEPLRQWFNPPPGAQPKRWPLDYFATSRVIPETINEYPWFTFNYADLHAHYFAMPLVLLIISLGWALYWKRDAIWKERLPQLIAGMCALALAALLITNTWDFPVYTLFIGFCLVSFAVVKEALPDASANLKSAPQIAAFAVRASSNGDDYAGEENSRLPLETEDAGGNLAAFETETESFAEREVEPVVKPKPRTRRTTKKAAESLPGTEESAAAPKTTRTKPPAPPRRTTRRATTTGTTSGALSDAATPRARSSAARTTARTLPAGSRAAARPSPVRVAKKPPVPLHANPYARALMITGAVGFVALVCAAPFLIGLHSEAQGPMLLEQPGSPMGAWLLLWAPMMAAWVLTVVAETRHRLSLNPAEWVLVKRFLLIPLVVWAAALIATGSNHFVLIFLLMVTFWTAREAFLVRQNDALYVWLCRTALCGLLALVWSETTWAGFLGPPHHRQDTVFKFGLQAWYLLGAAAACGALRMIPTAIEDPAEGEPETQDVAAWKFWPRPAQIAVLLMLPVCFVASLSTVMARSQDFKQFVGWDAWAHLAPPERRAAAWLAKQGKDGVYILEAEEKKGGDYTEYSRYAHATGLPTVVGPQAHTFQWGVNWDDIMSRKENVRTFYTTTDAAKADEIASKYNVSFVVCGEMERLEYGAEAVARVEARLRVVFQDGEGEHRTVILAAR